MFSNTVQFTFIKLFLIKNILNFFIFIVNILKLLKNIFKINLIYFSNKTLFEKAF